MPLASGMIVARNLRLVRLLAEGGMGSVWIADHLGLKTQVAVKFIAEAVVQDPTIKMRFEREATAAAQIRSPHVVQIFDHGLAEGRTPYIVMELLEGESLGRRLDRLGALTPRETASIVGQVCRALSKAHAGGVVHRDIKPDNIFLTDSDGELFVKVLDFGIAKQTVDQPVGVTSTGMAVGTPLYMSPEQSVSAKDVTQATDLWAVAAVAYRCLTGQVPFQGDTFGALCVIINRGAFAAPSTLRPGIPPSFDAWFAKGLAVLPAERFASARELADQFSVAAGFPAGVQVSVPSALPPRSESSSVAAPVNVGRAPAQTPLSAQTVTVHPSQPQGLPRDAVATVQTGASIAGAEVGRHADGGARPRRRTVMAIAALAGLGAIAAALLLTLGRTPPELTVSTGVVQATSAPSAVVPENAATEERRALGDLGASGGATIPAPLEPPATQGEPGAPPRPLPSAEGAKALGESRKRGASPAVSGASTSGGKPPAKSRPRPQPTAEPGRDLMEP